MTLPFRLLIAACCATPLAQAAPLTSFFPERELGRFLADNFDLASVRSSFGPRRTPERRTFTDFGLVASKAGDDVLEFDEERWFYQLRVTRRADINGDGIEDLELCFTDRAKGGSYDSRKGLLVSRYSDETYAVALSYEIEGCTPPKPVRKK